MQSHPSTTPFGRRSLTLAHVAGQAVAKQRNPETIVNKWTVFRDICVARSRLGVSERALTVLDALLSFHQETTLSGEGLVVFPSNENLSLRAHGMAPATLRRHLAVLVTQGLIVRRDSPNGKRYARKGRGGEVELAFGFDLAPLVTRAHEYAALAEQIRAEERALKRVKESITITRRDIAKMIEMAIEEGVALVAAIEGASDWMAVHVLYRGIVGRIERNAQIADLEAIAGDLAGLAAKILMALENHVNAPNMGGNESQNERHKHNSKPDSLIESEPAFRKDAGATILTHTKPSEPAERTYPLSLVMKACPDIADYAKDGIGNWSDFIATAEKIRPMLGVSMSGWEEARAALGGPQAAVTLAAILQRAGAIKTPGAYLRALTRKAEAGEFSLGPVLMALLSRSDGEKRSA
jgi:replication initiation protein RepC